MTIDPQKAELQQKIREAFKREKGVDLPVSFFDELDKKREELLQRMTPEDKELNDLLWRSAKARESFSVEGFRHFFWCLWRREVVPYALRDWVPAFMSGEWTILECFRGSTKSTTLTITFSAFVLLHFPHSSILIVQANDTAANKSTAAISSIIESFSGWKVCAPNLVPDKERGWGANGYFIKDENFIHEKGYGAWVEKTMQDHTKDPSFVGAGITSADVVGMHPRWLFFDDIHDRQNSTYPKDRENVVKSVRENVIPVITKPGGDKPFIGVACTFWDDSDAYHILLETGLFKHIKTPILRFVEQGADAEFEGKPVKLVWKSGFPIGSVKLYRDSNDSATFRREYLCDETNELDRAYKYQFYKQEELDPRWITAVGVDPVSVPDASKGISHFAMLVGCLTPYNSVVVFDGILERCGALQGEEYVVQAQTTYPNFLKSVVEGDGSGALFSANLTRHPGLVSQTVLTSEIGRGNKFDRQYRFLEPLWRSGAVKLSDAGTPILRAVRRYLDKFPNFSKTDPEADIGDALVLLAYAFPQIWTNNVVSIVSGSNIRRVPPRVVPDLGSYRYLGGRT